MPKNKGKGGKNRKRGKNEADDEKRELVFKEDGQEYAQVLRMLGNGRCESMCIDGTKRLSHIRGKMHKKVWIAAGDIILVGLRDYQDDKADVILKYMPANTQVGIVYQQIIADVIESSRVDFEEGGVDENVLEVLRQGWQKKLSQLEVATFPWDPKPEPVLTVSNPPTLPSNMGSYQQITNPAISQPNIQQIGINNNNGPRIKSEPGLEGQPMPQYPALISNLPPTITTAQQRAAAHLHNNYGHRAAASINAIQQSALHGQQGAQNIQQIQVLQMMQQQQQQQQQKNQQIQQQQQHQIQQQQQQQIQQQQQQQIQQQQVQHQQIQQQQHKIQPQNQPTVGPGQNQQSQNQMTQQEYQYKQIMAAQAAVNQQNTRQRNPQTNVGSAQTDGTLDEVKNIEILSNLNSDDNDVSINRRDIDGLIRQKIVDMSFLMEGGGLMLPLRRTTSSMIRSKKDQHNKKAEDRPNFDGADDDDDQGKDEEFDEDAINSDLDDPDDGLNEEDEEEDGLGHIMLCMYDKVQRVKNKWKCVMKDGVLTVNNKEYVFHKATGEYEW